MATQSMRGLTVFISDVRACQNKDQEKERVEKELANIRTKFRTEKGLSAYDRKKYAWKMLYIYMLGYDVDFGHMEAVGLISGAKFGEKQVGYMVTSVLLDESQDFLRLMINTVRNDIISRNESFQCLALTAVANIGGKEFAESLTQDVAKLLTSSTTRPLVRKKASLCLLRLYRKNPEILSLDQWSDRLIDLLEERDMGVLTGVMSLLLAVVASRATEQAEPEDGYGDSLEALIPKVIRVLERVTSARDVPQEYTYYGLPSPWLQVKSLRVLQYFKPPEDQTIVKTVHEVLRRVLSTAEAGASKNNNKNNAVHAVLFEAIALATHLESSPHSSNLDILNQCTNLLGRFLSSRESNIRYLALETLSRLAVLPGVLETAKQEEPQVLNSLRDPDISIRRRALDLLYSMCDRDNARKVVEELLNYLTESDIAIREELALKIAILAEKFAPSLQWYIDVCLTLLEQAGEFVSDDIWFRVVQIVTNNDDLQEYAASKVLSSLQEPGVHETMIKCGGYILGEFGHLTVKSELATEEAVFQVLTKPLPSASSTTKSLLVSALSKFVSHSHDPQMDQRLSALLSRYERVADQEMQQRAIEYKALMTIQKNLVGEVFADMPKFPERESTLVRHLRARESAAEDASVQERYRSEMNPETKEQVAIPLPVEDLKPIEPSADANESAPPDPMNDLLGMDSPPRTNNQNALQELTVEDNSYLNGNGNSYMESRQQESNMDDFFGESNPVSVTNGGAFGAISTEPLEFGESIQPSGSITEWFKKLALFDSGILYEDPNLQVGLKIQVQRETALFNLYFGNKNSDSQLEDFHFSVSNAQFLRVQADEAPRVLNPKQQVQIKVEITCIEPFKDSPQATLSYRLGHKSANASLAMPAVLTKFLTPMPILNANDFFTPWNALSAPPQKMQELVQGVPPMEMTKVRELFSQLHLGVANGLDPNENNLVAASGVCSSDGQNSVVLVRLEVDPKTRMNFRITVASQNPKATAAVWELLLSNLKPDAMM